MMSSCVIQICKHDIVRISILLITYHWYANLVHVDVRVGRDDRTSSIVHSFPHHVLAEKTFLLLKNLK